jgi:transglutaminase/protease-like cytokinesis protein 3
MATVLRTNNTKGVIQFLMTNVNDETERLSLTKDETVLIQVTGLTANTSTAQVKCYVGDNSTGVAVKDASGVSSFTSDFALGFTAPGKCSITVVLTVDGGGTTTATFAK